MHRLSAPAAHRGLLAQPPLDTAGELLLLNQERAARVSVSILGKPLASLRQLARAETLAAAQVYLKSIGVVAGLTGVADLHQAPWFVTGHQPELYHPGVWAKNFAVFGLARQFAGVPLNLIIDADAVKRTTLRVPDLRSRPWRAAAVAFDHWAGAHPFEDAAVRDEAVFERFPQTVAELLKNAPFEPLLPRLWTEALALRDRTAVLGVRLAGARRRLEHAWGCDNLEVPLGRLCQTEAFAWFASHVLAELPRFHALHNECLHSHRRAQGLHSEQRPFPDLAAAGDWLEAPFWSWRAGEPQRQRVFARRQREMQEVRLAEQTVIELPLRDGPEKLIAAFGQLHAAGWKIRTRALTTTLFARLLLADVFVHGIGGALYDGLTDALMAAFYGLEPPEFLTISATMLLPLGAAAGAQDSLRRLQRQRRDLHWNPDRFLNGERDQKLMQLLVRKRELIGQHTANPLARRGRYEEFRQIAERLRPQVRELQEAAASRGDTFLVQAAAEGLARDREFAFCLHPEVELRPFLTKLMCFTETPP